MEHRPPMHRIRLELHETTSQNENKQKNKEELQQKYKRKFHYVLTVHNLL